MMTYNVIQYATNGWSSSNREPQVAYDFLPGIKEPNHLDPVNVSLSLIPRAQQYDIDTVHRQGMIHCGTWQYIVDSESRVLLMKRGSQLVTCPNAWMAVGEHTLGAETPLETAQRGMREELGTNILKHIRFTRQLTTNPLYYFRDYGPANGNRIDRQVVYVWWIQLDVPGNEVQLDLDVEVADHCWLSISELEEWFREEWIAIGKGEQGRLCHRTLLELFVLGIDELKKHLGT